MPKIIKVAGILICMSVGVFFFQNCKIQKNEDGSYQTSQKLPEKMDSIIFSKGMSSSVSESVEHIEIDLINNKIIGHHRDLSSSAEPLCMKTVDLDANTRAELLEKYDQANYCFKNVKAEPGIMCTLQVKVVDQFAIVNKGKKIMDDKVGAPDACYTGVVMDFCNGGEDFYAFMQRLRTDIMNLCKE